MCSPSSGPTLRIVPGVRTSLGTTPAIGTGPLEAGREANDHFARRDVIVGRDVGGGIDEPDRNHVLAQTRSTSAGRKRRGPGRDLGVELDLVLPRAACLA